MKSHNGQMKGGIKMSKKHKFNYIEHQKDFVCPHCKKKIHVEFGWRGPVSWDEFHEYELVKKGE